MEPFDLVRLLIDLPEEGLARGAEGVVVMVHERPERAYEVEFCDENGETVTTLAVLGVHLERAPESNDSPPKPRCS